MPYAVGYTKLTSLCPGPTSLMDVKKYGPSKNCSIMFRREIQVGNPVRLQNGVVLNGLSATYLVDSLVDPTSSNPHR